MLMRRFLAGLLALFVAVAPMQRSEGIVLNSPAGRVLLGGSSKAAKTPVTLSVSNGTVSTDGTYVSFSANDVLQASSPFMANVFVGGPGQGAGTGCGGGAGRPQLVGTVVIGKSTPIIIGIGTAGATAGAAATTFTTPSYAWLNSSAYAAIASTGGAAFGAINASAPNYLSGSGSGACSASAGGPFTGGTGEGLSNESAGGAVTSTASPFAGAGGGGAGGAGATPSATGHGGAGGPGISVTIGSLTFNYGGGGGGTTFSLGSGCTPGAGGVGGGGAGVCGGNGTAGTNGTGGGGGGAYSANTGGRGGDGIVIIQPIGVKPTWGTQTILPSASCVSFATAPTLYYGPVMLCGSTSNCMQVERTFDSQTFNVPYVNNVCAWWEADAFAAASAEPSTLQIITLYDNTSNGFNATCSGTAGAEFGPPTYNVTNNWGSIRPASIEGQGVGSFQKCSNATITGNINAVSIVHLVNPRTSADYQGYWSLNNSALTSYYTALYSNAGSDLRLGQTGAGQLDTGFYPATSGPQVIAFSSSGTTGNIVQVAGSTFTNGTATGSQAFGGVSIGVAQNNASQIVTGIFDDFGFALWNQTLTSPQLTAAGNAISAPLSLPSSFTNNLVQGGSSLNTGYFSTFNQEPGFQAGWGKGQNGPLASWQVHTLAVAGRSLATEYTQRTLYASFYNAAYAINAVELDAPSNDIAAFTCSSAANCVTQADALITTYVIPLAQYFLGGCAGACGTGFNTVVFPTVIGRGSFQLNTGNFYENARLEYNSQLIAIAAANGIKISDRANSTILAPAGAFNSPAVASDPTRYYTGQSTHLNNFGYLTMGLTDRLAIAGF